MRAKAEDVADAILAKQRITAGRGFIVILPNCGAELWDVVQVTDTSTAQSQQKYQVIAIQLVYNPSTGKYYHRLNLGGV